MYYLSDIKSRNKAIHNYKSCRANYDCLRNKSREVLGLQNSLDNMIDAIGDEPEDTIAQNRHTVYSHTVPRDHITEGTEGLEWKENVCEEEKKIDEDTIDIAHKGKGEFDVNSKAGIDAVNEVANVGKFADGEISEQRKAGVDASSEIATYVDNGWDESVVVARRKVDASKSIPIKACQHRRCKGICIMRFNNLHGDKKKEKERKEDALNLQQ